MESDSRFSFGGEPSTSRQSMDQFLAIPQHSTLAQPRIAIGSVNPLDLTSAIQHELRRASSYQGWAPWNQQQQLGQEQQQPQLFGGLGSQASFSEADNTRYSIPCGSFHSGAGASPSHGIISQYIPRFDEGLGSALHHTSNRFEFTPETESLGSACQGFYSESSCTANGYIPGQHTAQVFETEARADSLRSCSPWVERVMQVDITPTPRPINLGVSSSQGTLSCVLSQTVDLQSGPSSDRQAQSRRIAFSSDPQHETTVELSADLCSDDDDVETRPLDVKREKRMLSNRASAQRSRQRRQERLDQLEVLTAKLRVENSTLQRKLTAAINVAKKFDDQNKDLLKKVDRLSKELEVGGKRARKQTTAKSNDCASSQQTACASSCDMVVGPAVNPHVMRDGGASTGTRSMSPSSSPKGWPMLGSYRSPPENHQHHQRHCNNNNDSNGGGSNAGSNGGFNGGTNQGLSPVRKSFSACRMESRKRSHDQSEGDLGETSPAAAALGGCCSEPDRPSWHAEAAHIPPLPGLDPSSKEGGDADDCLEEADRWLEFTECFL